MPAVFYALAMLSSGVGQSQAAECGGIARLDEPWWRRRHEQKLVEATQHQVDVVLLGDSIFHELQRQSLNPSENLDTIWREVFVPLHTLNLGFAGDTTDNLLWRVCNGELDTVSPRWAVILIGTNDQGLAVPTDVERTVSNIKRVVGTVRAKLPASRILLLALLPRQQLQEPLQRANEALAAQDWQSWGVCYMDLGHLLLAHSAPDLSLYLDPSISPGRPALHPNALGWAKLAYAIRQVIKRAEGPKHVNDLNEK